MDFFIRPATHKDINGLADLLEELFEIEEDFLIDRQKQENGLKLMVESQKDCVLVAEHESNVIGMCSVQVLISTAEGGHVGLVEDMVVSRKYSGSGIGKELLRSIEIWARKRGLIRLQLLADKDNTAALNFYAKRGWSKTKLVGLRKVIEKS